MMRKIKTLFNILINIFKEFRHKEHIKELRSKLHPKVLFRGDAFADEHCSFGDSNIIHQGTHLSNTSVGSFTYIASDSKINNASIGSFCSIGPQVLIGLGKHPSKSFISTYPAFFSKGNLGCMVSFVEENRFEEYSPVEIGNDVWIGARAMILDGVKIGDGVIVAAGAIVNKNVEPYSIVGGVPAKLLRKRFSQDVINSLLQFQWWNKEITWIQENADVFRDEKMFIDLIEGEKNQSQ